MNSKDKSIRELAKRLGPDYRVTVIVCYRLEREQIGMGDIRNATAQKFGIWVRKTTGEYDFTKKYGQTADEAFAVIRSEICKLVDAGARDDFNEIRRNMIAPNML